ncbi:TolC family protein [Corallococcus sp. M34]|uniref:TolC family protein n=1 Tax=Citreicoccus inhibens TaxID=2849499 RepID=UPI001315574A|nr:TolC family protein [Citreicoccus inhibens]MBU8897339.1 TolC family protein [Citreicoccus inhibens]
MTLDAALAEAAGRAPGIAAGRAREAMARGDIEVARTFAPLTVSLAAGGNDPHWAAGVSQRLFVPGARGARIHAAELGAEGAEADRRANELTVRATTRRAYFALVRARQLESNAERTLRLAQESEAAVHLRFETGAAPELEWVQATLARASAEVAVSEQHADTVTLSAELAVLLGRDPRRLLAPGEEPVPPPPSLDAAVARAAQAPRARAKQADVDAARESLRAAKRERWPTPVVGVSLEGDGPHGESVFLRGALDLEVPTPGLGRGELDRLHAAVSLAEAQADEDRRQGLADIVVAHARLTSALATLRKYEADILPGLETTERMALDSYRAGRSPLLALNEALKSASDLRAQFIQAAFTAQSAFADLEVAVGSALP